jgi:hypothetical protein
MDEWPIAAMNGDRAHREAMGGESERAASIAAAVTWVTKKITVVNPSINGDLVAPLIQG